MFEGEVVCRRSIKVFGKARLLPWWLGAYCIATIAIGPACYGG